MTTVDLVKMLAKRLKISQKKAKWLLYAHFSTISHQLASGNKVVLRGFGAFETKQTKQREMRIPSTGEKVLVPSKTVASFKPAQRLKDDVKIWRPSS